MWPVSWKSRWHKEHKSPTCSSSDAAGKAASSAGRRWSFHTFQPCSITALTYECMCVRATQRVCVVRVDASVLYQGFYLWFYSKTLHVYVKVWRSSRSLPVLVCPPVASLGTTCSITDLTCFLERRAAWCHPKKGFELFWRISRLWSDSMILVASTFYLYWKND